MPAWTPGTYPEDSLQIADIPLWFRYLEFALQDVVEREHEDIAGNYGAASDSYTGGEHLKGSAKAFFDDYETAPNTGQTTRPDGSTALSSADAGRLLFDTDAADDAITRAYFWDGTAWQLFAEKAPSGNYTFTHETAMKLQLQNIETATGAGDKDVVIAFLGRKANDTSVALAHIKVAHEGTSDDGKGYLSILLNDGDDGLAPSKEAVRIGSDGLLNAANSLFVSTATGLGTSDSIVCSQNAIKTYVDDNLRTLGTRNTSLTVTNGVNVQAAADGFLTVWFTCSTEARIDIFSDATATPTQKIGSFSAQPNTTDKVDGMTVPIKKDDYYRVDIITGTGTLAGVWIPIA